ncbi:OmpA/MotB family protein [Formosa agariphila KMM 3901]|uniref:OmpA/MotB family protein n=1 Tax=Formosa agariphila (strain DSM 15362 / KCTC 12365 / LMG 23005 / KMM 3901 / M-2Alg 35-1) TaxID=1347342 RepID=T2KMC8_FORAG|nr:OmpA family protein [Formosa agariphila]CDF80052.1 OmpA/MotB family protein [Formosa agariphila KMM 3901]
MKKKIIFAILALSSTFIFAQKKVADKFFKNYAYVKASDLYQDAVKKGDSSAHVLTRLGDCYYNNSNSEQAAVWYSEAIKKYDDVDPIYYYKYAQSLRSLGQYEDAVVYLEKFNAVQADEDRIDGTDFTNVALYEKLKSTEGVYVELVNLPINTKNSDFGGFEHNGTFYFASTSKKNRDELYAWNNEPFLDIYQSQISESTDGEDASDYSYPNYVNADDINTKYHEASVAITNDGKTMYFTRDNVSNNKKLKADREGTSHLKIYKATYIDSTWQDVKELSINDKVFSTGHPALSPDNKTLYFTSDREGGFGQTDIWKVAILGEDNYGFPVNLGAAVNTEGKEMFPFVAQDETLYFSSDSYLNLGFLDIFKSDILKGGTNVENLGAPYNSGYDDFAFNINPEKGRGYLSSNREGGMGGDDIYSFEICYQHIKGTVRDSRTVLPLAFANVQLIDETGKVIEEQMVGEDGMYSFRVRCNATYNVLGSKADYKDDLQSVSTSLINGNDVITDLNLIPLIIDDEIVLNPIFFDFDKWDIRTDAAYELENIVSVMREHPNMVIKIESHTDSRGPDNYNLTLSDKRAKSTRDYILSREIDPSRIESAIGYGETQLINECANGVKCTKEQHQANRRSKFIILGAQE